MSHAEYNALPGVRWSQLKEMRRSPLHYKHSFEAPKETTDAMRVGTAIHTATLEPSKWEERHPIWPAKNGARRGKEWDALVDAHPGADILTEDQAHRAIAAARAITNHPVARQYLRGDAVEHVIQWTDSATGIACKARVDELNAGVVEVKSTHDPMPKAFARLAADLGYHGQVAFYDNGMRSKGRTLIRPPVIITVEQKEPHDVVVFAVPPETLEKGRRLVDELLGRLAWCLETHQWPGIAPDDAVELWLPPWTDQDETKLSAPITLDGVAL